MRIVCKWNVKKSHLYYHISKVEISGFNESNSRKIYDPAKFILVLIIKVINFNWKQPVTYYFYFNSSTGFKIQDIILTRVLKL